MTNLKTSKQLPPGVVKRMERVIFEELPALGDVSPSVIVEKIYSAVDFYYKKAIAPGAVCKKGCSWCCRVPVDVSAIEVQYIHDKTGINCNELEKGLDWSREPDKTKCPFLKNDCCSIYEARPFNCRVFASMDSPDYCVDGSTEHHIYNWMSNGGLEYFRNLLDQVSAKEYECAPVGDIREWYGQGKISVTEE